jgi:hypothetical protein
MKLGLIADIHEAVELLRRAIDRLRNASANRFVMLGDVFETGDRIAETVEVLAEADIPGVWGNHDYGLCVDVAAETIARYPAAVIAYMGTLRPRLVLDDVLIQHTEPRGNPEELMDLWLFDEWPPSPETLAEDFGAFNQHRAFVGHRHRWSAHTPEGPLGWDGSGPLLLPRDRRCVVTIHAVADAWCGLYDRTDDLLRPIRLV